MDASKPSNNVVLFATDIEELKSELGRHLGKAMQRNPPATCMCYKKTPMGFEELLVAGERFEKSIVLAIPGVLNDFMSITAIGVKDVTFKVTLFALNKESSFIETLKDGFRQFSLPVVITEPSVLRISIVNNGKVNVTVAVGFTFSEGVSNANMENQLIGSPQERLI